MPTLQKIKSLTIREYIDKLRNRIWAIQSLSYKDGAEAEEAIINLESILRHHLEDSMKVSLETWQEEDPDQVIQID
jgi:hypothetical protein